MPKTRSHRSSMTKLHPTTTSARIIRSTTQSRKEINATQSGHLEQLKFALGHRWEEGGALHRTPQEQGRRKSKDAYRRRGAQAVKTKPGPLLPELSLSLSLLIGLATPSTGDLRLGRPAVGNGARLTGHKGVIQPPEAISKPYPQSQNAYDTQTHERSPRLEHGTVTCVRQLHG